MVRFLITAISCILLSVPAMASKARLLSLGQDPDGSMYIDDTRDVFLNPAYLNDAGDFINLELGASTVTPYSGPTGVPTAEGGAFRSFGSSVKAGLQLGRSTDTENLANLVNGALGTALPFPQNTVEAIVAGNAGNFKWGGGLLYGMMQNNSEVVSPATSAYPNYKANTIELQGGLEIGVHRAWIHADLSGHAERQVASGSTENFDLSPGATVGWTMDLPQSQKVFVTGGYEAFTGRTSTANATDRNGSLKGISAGWVQFLNPDDGTRVFYTGGLSYANFDLDSDLNSQGVESEQKIERFFIPIALGLETKLTDWMTLRGSVRQNLLIDQRKTTVTDRNSPNSTTVAAGLGIRWKKVIADATLTGADGGGGAGHFDGSNLFENLSFTYFF
jgi:hypothetical protein